MTLAMKDQRGGAHAFLGDSEIMAGRGKPGNAGSGR
jgi:hypothetical protein